MSYQPPFAKPYDRRCSKCGGLFNTGTPGARWTSKKGAPRYLHPGCQQPGKGWKQSTT